MRQRPNRSPLRRRKPLVNTAVGAPRSPERRLPAIRQRGQAFLLSIVLLLLGAGALIFNLATPGKVDIDKDKVTADALAQAKG